MSLVIPAPLAVSESSGRRADYNSYQSAVEKMLAAWAMGGD